MSKLISEPNQNVNKNMEFYNLMRKIYGFDIDYTTMVKLIKNDNDYRNQYLSLIKMSIRNMEFYYLKALFG